MRLWIGSARPVTVTLPTCTLARDASEPHAPSFVFEYSQLALSRGMRRPNRRSSSADFPPNLHSRAGCVDRYALCPDRFRTPNLHSRAGCVGKHHQNAGCMYGIHIHNLYLAECLDLLWRKTRLRIRHASRLLGVESPMPTVRRPRKHSVHFPFARSVSLMIFSISLVARFKLAL